MVCHRYRRDRYGDVDLWMPGISATRARLVESAVSQTFGTLDLLNKEIANMGNEQIRHCRIGKVLIARFSAKSKGR